MRVIRHMNENFAKPLSVMELAEMAHMSIGPSTITSGL